MSVADPTANLRCPTCEAWFLGRFNRDVEEAIRDPGATMPELYVDSPWYVTCLRGHRWAVKEFLSPDEDPPYVVLGHYLGGPLRDANETQRP